MVIALRRRHLLTWLILAVGLPFAIALGLSVSDRPAEVHRNTSFEALDFKLVGESDLARVYAAPNKIGEFGIALKPGLSIPAGVVQFSDQPYGQNGERAVLKLSVLTVRAAPAELPGGTQPRYVFIINPVRSELITQITLQ